MSYEKVNVVWAYDGYGYVQSTDTRTGVVDVTYVYDTGKAMGVRRKTYGRSKR